MAESFIHSLNNTNISNKSGFILLPLYADVSLSSTSTVYQCHTTNIIKYAGVLRNNSYQSLNLNFQYTTIDEIDKVNSIEFASNDGYALPVSYSQNGSLRCGYTDHEFIIRAFIDNGAYLSTYGNFICCIYVEVE